MRYYIDHKIEKEFIAIKSMQYALTVCLCHLLAWLCVFLIYFFSYCLIVCMFVCCSHTDLM